VARAVMERCPHNVLTSDGARLFAEKEGFSLDPKITNCVVNICVGK
jgi:isoaspartyl peptidase/L-asparaginase-like protein (Ntn-hydrolase superfamily)